MKVYLCNYGTGPYKDLQLNQGKTALQEGIVDDVIFWSREMLGNNFVGHNHWILSQPRGAGYWLWKPYIILKTLESINHGDIVLYMDAGDGFVEKTHQMKSDIINQMTEKGILLTSGSFRHSDYCKKDCFVLMGCDEHKYHVSTQIEAGMGLFKKTDQTIEIVREWLLNCSNPNILTDLPNTCGDNYLGFVDHRHDQAVLNNLAVKYSLPQSHFLRKYIIGNAYSVA